MTYVALLRGINVGGKAAVDMRTLRGTFERLGFDAVRTYINSGNVIFTASIRSQALMTQRIEDGIAEDFGLEVPVLVRTAAELGTVTEAVPTAWTNNASMRCDVLFLWPDVDRRSILEEVPQNPSIEDVLYVPGALVRRVDRGNITRSPMNKIVGTDLYRRVTMRNINTVRKLHELATTGPMPAGPSG